MCIGATVYSVDEDAVYTHNNEEIGVVTRVQMSAEQVLMGGGV